MVVVVLEQIERRYRSRGTAGQHGRVEHVGARLYNPKASIAQQTRPRFASSDELLSRGLFGFGILVTICCALRVHAFRPHRTPPRYLEIVSELLLTVRQMENTLNKRRVTARRGSRAGGGDQGPSDKDKIMMQARVLIGGAGMTSRAVLCCRRRMYGGAVDGVSQRSCWCSGCRGELLSLLARALEMSQVILGKVVMANVYLIYSCFEHCRQAPGKW